jgi:hypothetical protein
MPAIKLFAGMARAYSKPKKKPQVSPAVFAFLRQSQC